LTTSGHEPGQRRTIIWHLLSYIIDGPALEFLATLLGLIIVFIGVWIGATALSLLVDYLRQHNFAPFIIGGFSFVEQLMFWGDIIVVSALAIASGVKDLAQIVLEFARDLQKMWSQIKDLFKRPGAGRTDRADRADAEEADPDRSG